MKFYKSNRKNIIKSAILDIKNHNNFLYQGSANKYKTPHLLLLFFVICNIFLINILPNKSLATENVINLNNSNQKWHKINESVTMQIATSIAKNLKSSKSDKNIIIAITFKLAKDWKIYGKDSSVIGTPPQFLLKQDNKDLSDQINILWPEAKNVSEKIGDELFKYSIYQDLVTIPLIINSQNIKQNQDLELTINFGLCKEICLFVSQNFTLLPPNETNQDLIDNINDFIDKNQTENNPKKNVLASTETTKSNNFKQMILFALFAIFGGLILNIMPCVLPVLSIKILSFVKYSKSTTAEIRFAFSAVIIGIIASFFTLGIFAIIIKATGNYLGWGLQFQNPYFLIFLLAILLFFIKKSNQKSFQNFISR